MRNRRSKSWKALLIGTGENVDQHKIHVISALARRLGSDHPLHGPVNALDHLTAYSAASHYPSADGTLYEPPPPEELGRDLEAIKELAEATRRHLGLPPRVSEPHQR